MMKAQHLKGSWAYNFKLFTESELQPSEMTRHTWLYTRMHKVRLDIDKIIDSESVLTVVIMTGSSESSRRALMRPGMKRETTQRQGQG